ncbi:MAG: YfhO family protein, partial [Bacteroidota bacterium]
QDILNMLNTRYFILPGQDRQPQAQRNPGAFGPAWLVNNIQTVATNDAEFAALGSVDNLKSTAIIHEEFADAINGLTPSGQGSINITKYSPDELTYDFNSSSEQLVVFSEMWYGPDLGWEVEIDGQPAELIRTNYVLRGLRVPAGQHVITMKFVPSSFYTGRAISMICSLLILLGIVGYAAYSYLKKDKLDLPTTS